MAIASAAFICLTNWFYAKRVTDDIDKLKARVDELKKIQENHYYEHEDDGDDLGSEDALDFVKSGHNSRSEVTDSRKSKQKLLDVSDINDSFKGPEMDESHDLSREESVMQVDLLNNSISKQGSEDRDIKVKKLTT